MSWQLLSYDGGFAAIRHDQLHFRSTRGHMSTLKWSDVLQGRHGLNLFGPLR